MINNIKNVSERIVNNPKVSVVIPMYNVEKYIAVCLDSVLRQTFSNYEIICVDDGCKDQTVDIVKSYKDERIVVVSQKNLGLSAARNAGICASKGEYVALLDSDDYWHPKKLEMHVAHLNGNRQVGVSYSASIFVDEGGRSLGIGQNPKTGGIDAKHILCRNPVGNGSSAVIRRLALDSVCKKNTSSGSYENSYFDESLRQSEDIEFWLRLALTKKWAFSGIPFGLTYYRVNPDGLSANLTKQLESWYLAISKNIKNNKEFFDKNFTLAKAYQYRYLARRAVQSGNRKDASAFLFQALRTNFRILTQEPIKTSVTLMSVASFFFPRKFSSCILRFSMSYAGKLSFFLNKKGMAL